MIVNLKEALKTHFPRGFEVCDLRTQDPDFNNGKGEIFRKAFDRAALRGDFR